MSPSSDASASAKRPKSATTSPSTTSYAPGDTAREGSAPRRKTSGSDLSEAERAEVATRPRPGRPDPPQEPRRRPPRRHRARARTRGEIRFGECLLQARENAEPTDQLVEGSTVSRPRRLRSTPRRPEDHGRRRALWDPDAVGAARRVAGELHDDPQRQPDAAIGRASGGAGPGLGCLRAGAHRGRPRRSRATAPAHRRRQPRPRVVGRSRRPTPGRGPRRRRPRTSRRPEALKSSYRRRITRRVSTPRRTRSMATKSEPS